MQRLSHIVLFFSFLVASYAAPETFTPAKYDAFVGDWQPANPGDNVARVFINKDGVYQVSVLMAFDDDGDPLAILTGTRATDKDPVELRGKDGWTGTLRPDCCGSPHLEINDPHAKTTLRLKQYVRPNARLRAPAPGGAQVIADLSGTVLSADSGEMAAGKIHGDAPARLHVEFRFSGPDDAWSVDLPGGARIVLTTSFGRYDDKALLCGALLAGNKIVAPLVRAERSLQEWQALDVEKHGAGVTVFLNGVCIHEKVNMGEPDARAQLIFAPLSGRAQLRNAWLSAGK